MARGGTYGDNMEITAFACAYGVDVKIYQRDFAYMVTAGQEEEGSGEGRTVAHIAYHVWEHYSSIRNLDGPHAGLPHVQAKVLSPEEEALQREKLHQTPHVLPWQIDVVSKSLPYLADKPSIKRALEYAKGDINLAVSNLLDAEEYGSTSSQQESSSVERDRDSDDDMNDGPNKKQDRRMSRVSRAQRVRARESRHALRRVEVFDGSQESIDSWESEASSMPDGLSTQPTSIEDNQPSTSEKKHDEDEGDEIAVSHPPPISSATTTSTTTTTTSNPTTKPPIRLKLHPPKPPDPSHHQQQRVGKTLLRQPGPRLSARDRKTMQKQAQKAARKERAQSHHPTSDSNSGGVREGGTSSRTEAGLALRAKGLGETPPVVETMRTLYI